LLELSKPSSGVRSIEIRQIYYSDETHLQLDPGFIPLDNRGEQPDWREYWPIRKFLLGHALNEDTLYGFFSPKFGQKTALNSATVHAFIASAQSDADVIAFSPFFDQGAVHLNTFEQAATNHPGIWPIFEQTAALIAPGIDPHAAPMDSRHSIFCNYFVATPAFWRRWLEKCEMLFALAEAGNSVLGVQLNAPIVYGHTFVPSKVFIIERIVSLLLIAGPRWRVKHYDPLRLPMSGSIVSPYTADLLVLDALKTAAIETGRASYLQMFHQIRATLMQNVQNARKAAVPQA
jgi:hypothetical protein